MDRFLKSLESQVIERVGDVAQIEGSSVIRLLFYPCERELKIASGEVSLIVLRKSEGVGELRLDIADGARLNLVELFVDGAVGATELKLAAASQLRATLLQMGASQSRFSLSLEGRDGEAEVSLLQLVTETQSAKMEMKIAHMHSDCLSRSYAKCVAAGHSVGEFSGLVYVAQGAQRTLAEQSSRNIQLSADATIKAEPQLEIYADDVKCSHGATVGQMNEEAIYYMMQRGLGEEQARKLQLEGFIGEIVAKCGIESLRESLHEIVSERLNDM